MKSLFTARIFVMS